MNKKISYVYITWQELKTSVIIASEARNTEMVEILLNAKANAEAKDMVPSNQEHANRNPRIPVKYIFM